MKFCEVSRNSISNWTWKFQFSILKNKKVLFLKNYFLSRTAKIDPKDGVSRPNFQWRFWLNLCQQTITQKIFIHANLNLGPDETDYSYLIAKKVWVDGTESHTFNELENIALSKHARTPILGCLVSDALAGEIVQVWKYKFFFIHTDFQPIFGFKPRFFFSSRK